MVGPPRRWPAASYPARWVKPWVKRSPIGPNPARHQQLANPVAIRETALRCDRPESRISLHTREVAGSKPAAPIQLPLGIPGVHLTSWQRSWFPSQMISSPRSTPRHSAAARPAAPLCGGPPRGATPAPRGPGGSNAIAAQRRLTPWRSRRGAGEGNAARSVTTLLLDASVLLAAFDPEDGHHEHSRALLETSRPASPRSTSPAMRSPMSPCGRGAHQSPWRPCSPRSRGSPTMAASSRPQAHSERGRPSSPTATPSRSTTPPAPPPPECGHRLVSCDERDLVSKGLAVLPARAQPGKRSAGGTAGTTARAGAWLPCADDPPADRRRL